MFSKRIALGIAAAALAVTSLASPFMPTADAQVMFKHDIRVNYDSFAIIEGKSVYRFRATNVGITYVDNVGLVGKCYYLTPSGGLTHTTQFLGGADFPQDEVVKKSVSCPWHTVPAVKASLEAVVQDDLTPANNIAFSL